ncbi:MAG: hypothetical protein KF884_12105 [Fimbriimonadaceae bacterium]|nr:hypothetical protein [Fimbriimonadaceae bacterium]QYK58286.1 MAG: hypothetical protein KF884_12105 [Fimbriimonadaceae bacterium]
MPKCPAWVVVSAVLVALISLLGVAARHRVESENRAVGLLMEASALKAVSSLAGSSLPDLLAKLKSSGLTGVALSSEKAADLIAQGSIQAKRDSIDPGVVVVTVVDPVDGVRALRAVKRSFGGGAERVSVPSGAAFKFKGDMGAFLEVPVGIDPRDAEAVRSADLVIVARHENTLGFGPAQIRDTLDESKEAGATAYLPAGEQVLGQRKCVEDTALALNDLGMELLVPEFVKIGGSTKLASLMPEGTLRLHSIQQAEVDRMDPASLNERFAKAFRERNVRWLLVRPTTFGTPDPVASVQGSLAMVRGAIFEEKGGVKTPRPFNEPSLPSWLPWAIGLAGAPALAWLGWILGGASRGAAPLLAVSGALLSAFSGPEATRLWGALALATAMPVIGYAWYLGRDRTNAPVAFLAMTGFSLAGGLSAAGMLVGLPYMLQLDQFMGVKVTLFVPLVMVAWLLVRQTGGLSALAGETVRWGPLLTGLCILAAVGFMLVRAGNEAPAAVSGLELKLRSLLEGVMQTRPRTKEFLIGHPALILGLAVMAAKESSWRTWAPVLLLVGAIGQTSVVNTLCHLHTPVEVSLTRILIGLILGGILGTAAWILFSWGGRRRA